ncbi:MAG TPA: type I 3-dehydroquinate dehydratase [Chthoniobacterales bacterium]|nr:type I 3-dehydroquinate dehydratase [Chthoniobacterales bacterium]
MRPKTVGVIFSRADFRRALRMRKPPDLFELRLDRLIASIDEVSAASLGLPAPFIATARAPREGGANDLSTSRRRALLLAFLPRAAWVDIEFRSARSLAAVSKSAAAHHAGTIISFHDFKTTPPAAQLEDIVSGAVSLGADLIKVATRTDTPAQLETLLDFFERKRRTANVVAMGIGKLGRISRVELARRGCLLNYGHLGSPAAAGQLAIADLRRILA